MIRVQFEADTAVVDHGQWLCSNIAFQNLLRSYRQVIPYRSYLPRIRADYEMALVYALYFNGTVIDPEPEIPEEELSPLVH